MAYISIEEVAEIRKELKNTFGKNLKFSVKRENYSSVVVSIVSGNVDFSDLTEEGYRQVNPYWPNLQGKHADLFAKIINIVKKAPAKAVGGEEWFDKSDIQSDYFHTAFYYFINIGKWNKPYVCNA